MHLLGTCQAMRLNPRRDRFGHATAGRFGSTALHAHDEVARGRDLHRRQPRRCRTRRRPATFAGRPIAPPRASSRRRAWLDVAWLPRLFATHDTRRRRVRRHGRPAGAANLLPLAPGLSCRGAAPRLAILLAASRHAGARRHPRRDPRARRRPRRAARRFAGLHGVTAATATVPRTSADALPARAAAGRRARSAPAPHRCTSPRHSSPPRGRRTPPRPRSASASPPRHRHGGAAAVIAASSRSGSTR